MQQIDLTPKDLDRIVVAEGPGSYTDRALRSQRQRPLAHTLGIELVGVSSPSPSARWSRRFVVPVMMPVETTFMQVSTKMISWSHQKGIFHLSEVLERAATSEQVTLSEKSRPFKEIAPSSPRATYLKPCQMQKIDVSVSTSAC